MSGGHDDGLPEEHEEHVNHEAWVIPYADLLTLLMAMFIALFAMSTVDMSKFKALAIGFNEALNGPNMNSGVFSDTGTNKVVVNSGGSGNDTTLSGGGVGVDTQANTSSVIKGLANQKASMDAARAVEQQTLKQVENQIQKNADARGLAGKLSLRMEERGLVVTVVTDKVLFDSGSADLKPEGLALLKVVEDALTGITNPIVIEGHTDSVPISTPQYPSNWELSGARAGSVARYFESLGMNRARLRPEGMADLFPVASNATVDGRAKNRRVEIVVQSNLVDRALRDNNLTDKTVTTSTTAAVGAPVENPVDNNITPSFTR